MYACVHACAVLPTDGRMKKKVQMKAAGTRRKHMKKAMTCQKEEVLFSRAKEEELVELEKLCQNNKDLRRDFERGNISLMETLM